MPAGEDVSFVVRLESYMARRGFSPAELARRTGLSEATISRYLAGKRRPTYENLVKMAKALNVSLDELAGTGVDKQSHALTAVLDEVFRETKRRLGLPHVDSGTRVDESITRKELSPIPVIGKVSAGEGFAFSDQGLPLNEGEYTIPRFGDDDPNAYGIVVDDDSMEPVIQEGWEVVAGPNEEWKSGTLAILRLESGQMRVRRAFDKGENLLLQSYNPDYEAEIIPKTDIQFIHRLTSIRPK